MEILNCNGTIGDIIPSPIYIWSLNKCDQPKIMGTYRFGYVLDVEKWSGYLTPCTICMSTTFQIYTWLHHKVLEVIIELLKAQCVTENQQIITAKEPIIQFHKKGECPVRKFKKIPIWSFWMELVTGKFLRM